MAYFLERAELRHTVANPVRRVWLGLQASHAEGGRRAGRDGELMNYRFRKMSPKLL